MVISTDMYEWVRHLQKSKSAHKKCDGVIRRAITSRERRPKKLQGFEIFYCDLTLGFWSNYS